MKNNKKNSPLNQDPKFDTTLHDYGRRAHTMTAKERSDYRTGQKHALTFAPTGGALGVAGKAIGIIKRNIGGGAFSIGQGLVRKFGTKGMKKTYDRVFTPGASQQTTRPDALGRAVESFSSAPKQYLKGSKNTAKSFNNAPKQYLSGGKNIKKATKSGPKVKTMQDLTPTVKGYDVKVIGQSPKAKPAGMNKPPASKPPKVYGKDVKRNYNTQPKLTQAEKDLHSARQHEYLQQQMKQKEVGSASSRLRKTHNKAVSEYHRKNPYRSSRRFY